MLVGTLVTLTNGTFPVVAGIVFVSIPNALPVATALTLFIYKNLSTIPEITLSILPADGGLKRLDTQSFSLNPTEVIRVTLETTGNVGAAGTFQAVIGYY